MLFDLQRYVAASGKASEHELYMTLLPLNGKSLSNNACQLGSNMQKRALTWIGLQIQFIGAESRDYGRRLAKIRQKSTTRKMT